MTMNQLPLVVSWGGGVNSTAMLIGMRERSIKPDLILFADTGGEKPETYNYLERFKLDWPDLVIVRRKPTAFRGPRDPNRKTAPAGTIYATLEEDCLVKSMLPSLAYGHRGCSQKWKIEPQDRYVAAWVPAVEAWYSGQRVTKAIGFDAGELRRATIGDDTKYHYWYPLIEWGWGRAECVSAIERYGLPVPPKSACFFCPASKKAEVLVLKEEHPDLYARAIQMERGAILGSVKGLGRSFSWETFAGVETINDMPCMCFDGEDE